MIWKDYSKIKGTHSFLSPSQYSWRNYDLEKLEQRRLSFYAAPIGTALHEYAADNIRKKFRMQKADAHSLLRYLNIDKKIPLRAIGDMGIIFDNLMHYTNDCIGFRMDPEVLLYFSPYCYGTTDAIRWDEKDHHLMISDLKTGSVPASFMQLENYAALFSLDYKIKPKDIRRLTFRIYQNGDVLVAEPEPIILNPIIDQMVEFNKYLMKFDET